MTKILNYSGKYDLEDRTLKFAKDVRIFVRKLPRTLSNIEDGKQLIRSSGSTGANYIEANEALSKKDFIMRIKICRKEAKESSYWLDLVFIKEDIMLEKERIKLLNESRELTKIFGSILEKSR
jgi:four helix bundle protein